MHRLKWLGSAFRALTFAVTAFFAHSVKADLTVFDDALASGWQNWSWATVDTANASPTHAGTASISVTAGAWSALYLSYVNAPINTAPYGKVSFWAHGGTTGGQIIRVSALLGGSPQPGVTIAPLTANTWTKFEIDLSALGAANSTNFNGLWFQEFTGTNQPVFYIDDVSLTTAIATTPPPAFDGQSVYGDGFVNGWQNWSWASVDPASNAVVSTGATSIAVTAGAYQALYAHHAPMPTQGYANLVFWIHGGASGGQQLNVFGLLSDSAQNAYSLPPLAADSWTKVTIPLSALGVANKTDLTGIWLQERAGQNAATFYLDDMYLELAPPPSSVNVTVDAAGAIRTVDSRIFAINTAIWDQVFNTATTAELLNEIDNQALRFPGGSISDVYHWKTNMSEGQTFQWATDFDDFANIAVTTAAQVFITVNYGTGTPEEAAEWVHYSNVVKQYGFKYWEVGNENYGTWEADNNVRPHDPVTYANRFKTYYEKMKAVDPTIKIGAVVQANEDSDANYTDQTVTNPRTGQPHDGWTAVLLATFKQIGMTPDFVVYHRYEQGPGGENDAFLLQSSIGWKNDAASIRQMLTDYLGAAGAAVEINCTENNSVYSSPGKQTTSLVNGLFLADSIGNILQTEFNSMFWWDLRNGQETQNNNSSSLYGWRNYGDYGIVNAADPSGPADRYPTFYVYKLLTHYARGGETVIPAATDFNNLAVYGVKEPGQTVRLLVINKHRTATLGANINLTGFNPATTAEVHTYGIPQDEAARTGVGSADVQSGTLAIPGSTFTYSAAPYSASVITLAINPANSLALKQGGYSLNRRINRFVQRVSVTNTGTAPVAGPVYLALDNLSPNTTLANAAGTTANTSPTGRPYVLVTASGLAPYATVNVVLEFTVPTSGGITHTPRAIVIDGAP